MGHRQWIVRAALVCGAATAGIALWSAADDTPAYAADRAAAVELPGTVLHRPALPEQASDRAREVARVAPDRKPECDQPRREPHRAKPAPGHDERQDQEQPAVNRPAHRERPVPDRPAKDPAPPAADPIDAAVDDGADDVEEQLPDVPPAPEPQPEPEPIVTLPATDPAPLPGAEDLLALLSPTAPALPPALAAPSALPALIGPDASGTAVDVATEYPLQGAVAELVATLVAACDNAPDPLDVVRPPDLAPEQVHTLGTSDNQCPTGPPRDLALDGLASVTAGVRCHAAGELGAAPLTALGRPVLQLLRVLWPRSDAAASRTEHPEPGPA